MNILITNHCESKCSYCFARDMLAGGDRAHHMKREDFRFILDFLERSRFDRLRLLGGEPLLHPRLGEFLDLATQRASLRKIEIFTGGYVPPQALRAILDGPTNVHVILNLNERREYNSHIFRTVAGNLEELVDSGIEVTLGYTLCRKDFDPSTHLEFLRRLGIVTLRWSLASPSPGDANAYVVPTGDKRFGHRVGEFLLECAQAGVTTVADCTVPPCLFDEKMRGRLEWASPGFGRPVPIGICSLPIDVGPDLSVWRCYGCPEPRHDLKKFKDLDELRRVFQARDDLRRWWTLPEGCATCDAAMAHLCQGGCLGPRYKIDDEAAGLTSTSAAEECDRLFALLRAGEEKAFLDGWNASRHHPGMTRYAGAVVLDAMAAELRGDQLEALRSWRRALPDLTDERKDWARSRIQALRDAVGSSHES